MGRITGLVGNQFNLGFANVSDVPWAYCLMGGIRRLERIRSRREKPSWGSWESFPDLWCGGHVLKESPSH